MEKGIRRAYQRLTSGGARYQNYHISGNTNRPLAQHSWQRLREIRRYVAPNYSLHFSLECLASCPEDTSISWTMGKNFRRTVTILERSTSQRQRDAFQASVEGGIGDGSKAKTRSDIRGVLRLWGVSSGREAKRWTGTFLTSCRPVQGRD